MWTRIGNYAKDYHITLKMQVANGSTKGVYNLIITAVGKYHDVASFIYAIENDSRLGFKIEDFSMTQYISEEKTNYVQGEFTCKEIRIDIKSIDTENNNTEDSKTNENNTKPNTNNTNNTTNTTNTNTTNTTNAENTTNVVDSYTNTTNQGNTTNTATT